MDQTTAAYHPYAAAYRTTHQDLPDHIRAELDEFVSRVGLGGRVLEIGSGGGRDAAYLEAHGLTVRRTDITAAFIDLLRQDGHAADVLDPLRDDLRDPARPDEPYDGIWANACLLHTGRDDLSTVLTRLREVTRPGATLRFSVKEGKGEAWSDQGPVAAPRLFVYWSEPELRTAVHRAGWTVRDIGRPQGFGDDSWLEIWTTW